MGPRRRLLAGGVGGALVDAGIALADGEHECTVFVATGDESPQPNGYYPVEERRPPRSR